MPSRPKPKYKPGDRVRRTSTRLEDDPDWVDDTEYGVIVAYWWDDFLKSWDYYIAFFGRERPPKPKRGQPDKPYVLRYLETSLTPGW